ncbi:hypothetical protein GQ53DRAFT_876604 [Thozetella sp. PMI_491]|nr:hypothetical protein GQ53DRAFT_876604 [Thozetella sp. PMI_491]
MHVSPLILLLSGVAVTQGYVTARDCAHDNCLRAFLGNENSALSFCAAYTSAVAIPSWAANCDGDDMKVQSACACVYTYTPSTTTSTATSSSATSPASTASLTTASVVTSTSASSTANAVPACHCTAWSQIAAAQSSCSDITLDNIAVPKSSSLPLTKLKVGATVTFVGNTSFEYTPSSGYKMVQISGNNVVIKGAPGSFFDGGGPHYWDGLGNGGTPKPGNFMKVVLTNHSLMTDIYVLNTPTHAIDVDGCYDSVFQRITVNNSLGDAPNAISGGKSAAHNTDGFNVGNVGNLLMQDCSVWGQDDCVALSVSNNVTIRNFYCSGTHGLSIAGGGSGPGQNVTNILLTNSTVTNSTYGLRIKTDYNATGSVVNVTYSNIYVSNIKTQGIDIEQDYLNGGPNGLPTNGVAVANINFSNITGWVAPGAADYYILCGVGSCKNFTYNGVDITGGTVDSSCNYPWSGCPGP